MAPIKEDTVDALKDLVHKLESRVEQLEAKLQSAEGGPVAPRSKANTDSIRMVLMGPPGAGMISPNAPRIRIFSGSLDVPANGIAIGKGTQAPRIKEKYCACHLVSYVDALRLLAISILTA